MHLSMKYYLFGLILLTVFSGSNCKSFANEANNVVLAEIKNPRLSYVLPSPKTEGNKSVEEALAKRRSRRRFQNRELSAEQLSQVLWAAYGITEPVPNRDGLRATPSAGALYPLVIYAAIGNVAGIEVGVYKYVPKEHKIIKTIDKDVREELSAAALGQDAVRDAPVTVIFCAVFSRITERYGERGSERYVFIELGHSAQNIYLQAETLELGACAIGAFTDSRVSEILSLPAEEKPLYLMPVGHM